MAIEDKKWGIWDSYLDPMNAYREAEKLRNQGWIVKITERRGDPKGIKYVVWLDGKKERSPASNTHPLVLKQYPIGEVPEKIEVSGLKVPIPEPRKPKDIPENTVIRTSEKFDNTIKHLGYESVSFTREELNGLGKSLPTDRDIINDSQRRLRSAEVVPDEKLGSRQLRHLKLARVVANDIFHTPVSVYAAVIPPASDRVRTAGLYGTTTGVIYINLDQLYSGRTTVDTLVHELGHHREYRQTGSAEDLSPAHAEAMTDVAARVVEDVAKGTFDDLLKEVSW